MKLLDIEGEFIFDLNHLMFVCIVIETKFTIHYIERTNYKDRGKIKWFAESKPEYWKCVDTDESARTSHVDGQDFFPRLYFTPEAFMFEFQAWLDARGLDITEVRHLQI